MPTYTGHPDNIVAHLLATFHVPKSRDTICIFPECGDGVTELAVARALISNDIRVTRVWLMDMRIPTLRPTQPPAFQVHIFQSYAELCHALQVAVVGATHVPTVLIPGVHQQQIPTDAHDARHLTQFMHVCDTLREKGHVPHPFLNYMSYCGTYFASPLTRTINMIKTPLPDPHTCVYQTPWVERENHLLWQFRGGNPQPEGPVRSSHVDKLRAAGI